MKKINPKGYWTYERCKDEALKYNTLSDFSKTNKTAHGKILKYGWSELCSHLTTIKYPDGYWTFERCNNEAQKYSKISYFYKNAGCYYRAAKRLGWFDEICSHMDQNNNLPFGYWNKERCHEEALKYSNRLDFRKKSPSAHGKAQRSGWIDEICSHIIPTRKPSGYWTKDRCQEEALIYTNRIDLQRKSASCYTRIHKSGWLDEMCSHMASDRMPNGYWIEETCREEALKYSAKVDFQRKSSGAYAAACKQEWFEDICDHMSRPVGHSYKWTFELCFEEALKYNHRSHFIKGSSGAYGSAIRQGWVDIVCEHMTPLGSKMLRYVYTYTFSDNSIYIGLTHDYKKRNWQHNNMPNSAVFKYKALLIEDPVFEVVSNGLLNVEDAKNMEIELINKYSSMDYNVLNIAKGGGIGGSTIKWTREICENTALVYKNKKDFREQAHGPYTAAYEGGYLDDICKHMDVLQNIAGYWSKKRCADLVYKYSTIKDFRIEQPNCYGAIRKNGWWEELSEHLTTNKIPAGYWTYERCYAESIKYKNKRDFRDNSNPAYSTASIKGWLDELCINMDILQTPPGYWTLDTCREEALKYTSKTEYSNHSGGSYYAAHKNKWLDDICIHMPFTNHPPGYWTKEKCHVEALKYSTKNEFQTKSYPAYRAAYRWNWHVEICTHMVKAVKVPKWTYEKCKEEALKYTNRGDFQKYSSGAYRFAKEYMDEICTHMVKKDSRRKWTPEKCKEEALKYTNKSDFHKYSSGASKASSKFLDEITGHMVKNHSNWKWTYENCKEEALKYKNKSEFQKGCSGAYKASKKYPNDIYSHMVKLPSDQGYWTFGKCEEEALKYSMYSLFKSESQAHKKILKSGWVGKLCSHMK